MKRALLIILFSAIMLTTLMGCNWQTPYIPEQSLSAEQKEEIKNILLTIEVSWSADVKYKPEYADQFENRELAQHVLDGFKNAIRWYKIIKDNLYEYSDGTVRIGFNAQLAYEPGWTVVNMNIVDDREPGVTYYIDAMDDYKSDYRFDDRKGLNNFEVYLIDLLENISSDFWSVGYWSDRRISIEESMREAQEQNERLGITAELLTENQKTEYSICQNIGLDIQILEDDLIELASYFSIS